LSNMDPIGKCLRSVDWWRHRWRHATLWCHTRDVTIFVAFGNYRTRINYLCQSCGSFKYTVS